MMNKIIICYQVNDSISYNYNTLHLAIEEFADTSIQPMKSVYFIETNKTTSDVYNFLTQFFDQNDRLRCDYITVNHRWRLGEEAIDRFK